MSRFGPVGCGTVRLGKAGEVGQGAARLYGVGRDWARLHAARHGRFGAAWVGVACLGVARFGLAGTDWWGVVGIGRDRPGKSWLGRSWQVGQVMAGPGRSRMGAEQFGKVGLGMAGGDRLGPVGFVTAWLGEVRQARCGWSGVAGQGAACSGWLGKARSG